jgi:ATP-dependent DNA helicase MPH1
MSSPSSEFEIDIDEDDLHQIEAVEQEAIAKTQSSPSTTTQQSVRTIQASPRSPSVYIKQTSFNPAAGRGGRQQTLPWLITSSNNNAGQNLKGSNRPNEPPTHHYLDHTAARTWIYPTNVSFREYQFNIVQKALLDNVLVSLPTGLGKTFIAATVMYNYYRWFPKSKIVFVAPTKPLVAQQVEACFKICGVPYSNTAQLTGNVQKPVRAQAYADRRVFYMTPQTLSNDIKSGLLDPKSIVCLVIDEAHRGTGNYAYIECVTFIRKKNPSFRILALSATPGSSVEAVQNVITALCIARVEIRIESSLDLLPYLHPRKTEVVTLPLTPEITELRDLFAKVIQHFLNPTKHLNDYRLRDPLNVTLFGIRTARDEYMRSPAANANQPLKFKVMAYLGVAMSLAHSLSLLTCHGIQPFYEKLTDLRDEYQNQNQKGKPSKTKTELLNNKDFIELMTRLKMMVDNPNTVGHPKLDRAASMIIDHFMQMEDQKQDTRVMVFAHYRSSAAELVRQLKRQEPIIKPTIFVGQASDTRGGAGMRQKDQIEVSVK